VGGSPCIAPTDIRLYYTNKSGQLATLPSTTSGDTFTNPPTILSPGQQAHLVLTAGQGCLNSPTLTYTGVVIEMAGRRMKVSGLTITTPCGAVVEQLWAGGGPQPTFELPPLQYSSLTALIDAPASAHANSTLDYIVTLSNNTRADIALDPCPVYLEIIYKNGATYRLDCAVPAILAGESVRFAMQLQLNPTYTPVGRQLLNWSIEEPGGASATATAPIDIIP
jgi:hypothetical protein